MADVQLGAIIVACGVCHREIPAVAVGHDDLQILAGLERRAQTDRKTQVDDRGVAGQPREPEDPGRDDLAAEDVDALEPLRADDEIGAWLGAAHQRRAIACGPAAATALLDLAVEKSRLAGIAGALSARRR